MIRRYYILCQVNHSASRNLLYTNVFHISERRLSSVPLVNHLFAKYSRPLSIHAPEAHRCLTRDRNHQNRAPAMRGELCEPPSSCHHDGRPLSLSARARNMLLAGGREEAKATRQYARAAVVLTVRPRAPHPCDTNAYAVSLVYVSPSGGVNEREVRDERR